MTQMTNITNLRCLDIDDLLILQGLLRGLKLSCVAQSLALTQPALSQRLRKMENIVFHVPMVERRGRGVVLTVEGDRIAHQADRGIELLLEALAIRKVP